MNLNIFAYGTLMIPSVMHVVTAHHFGSQKAILRDYARFTVKEELYPGIIPVTDAITEGMIYFNVDELSLGHLDTFEGDLYQRTQVRVETEGKGILNAETYVIKSEYLGYLSSKAWDVNEFIQKDLLQIFLMTYSGFSKKL
jgi:gamma-glutamylcyclotransferase (GGCT)/AIG2-like uncharacterized protein YtfP